MDLGEGRSGEVERLTVSYQQEKLREDVLSLKWRYFIAKEAVSALRCEDLLCYVYFSELLQSPGRRLSAPSPGPRGVSLLASTTFFLFKGHPSQKAEQALGHRGSHGQEHCAFGGPLLFPQ